MQEVRLFFFYHYSGMWEYLRTWLFITYKSRRGEGIASDIGIVCSLHSFSQASLMFFLWFGCQKDSLPTYIHILYIQVYTYILKIHIYTWKRWRLYIQKPSLINAHFLPLSASSHKMNTPENKISGNSEYFLSTLFLLLTGHWSSLILRAVKLHLLSTEFSLKAKY